MDIILDSEMSNAPVIIVNGDDGLGYARTPNGISRLECIFINDTPEACLLGYSILAFESEYSCGVKFDAHILTPSNLESDLLLKHHILRMLKESSVDHAALSGTNRIRAALSATNTRVEIAHYAPNMVANTPSAIKGALERLAAGFHLPPQAPVVAEWFMGLATPEMVRQDWSIQQKRLAGTDFSKIAPLPPATGPGISPTVRQAPVLIS
jgi:hypothetical protein